MDPLTLLSTSYKIALYIIRWCDEKQESNARLKSLGVTVRSVNAVLEGYDVAKQESMITALVALTDCLNETKEILQVATSKLLQLQNLIFPAKVTARITKVEAEMMKFVQIITLSAALAIQKQTSSSPSPSPSPSSAPAAVSALDFIDSQTTKTFWRAKFGSNVFAVVWDKLEQALKSDYTQHVDAKMLKDLRLRLDNFNTGSVSVCRLAEFIGDKTLEAQLEEYKHSIDKGNTIKDSATLSDLTGWSEDKLIKFPILIWVDDKDNDVEIKYAESRGVHVVKISTTADAKQWIKDNLSIIDLSSPTKLRIITNNVRQGADTALDINAGEDIIRFVRGKRCGVPILVYCGDLKYTAYIVNYDDVKATNTREGCCVFIDELKA